MHSGSVCAQTVICFHRVVLVGVRGGEEVAVERVIARALPTFLKQKADTFTLLTISDRL